MVLGNGIQFMFQSNAGSQRRTFHLIIALEGSCDDHHGTLVALDYSNYTRQMCNTVGGSKIQYDSHHNT